MVFLANGCWEENNSSRKVKHISRLQLKQIIFSVTASNSQERQPLSHTGYGTRRMTSQINEINKTVDLLRN